MSKREKQKHREWPAIQWERVASEDYDAEVGYALLAGTQLPPVKVQPLTEDKEDES